MSEATPNPQPQQIQIQIREDKAATVYSNINRVGGTPDDIYVDFMTNFQQPTEQTTTMVWDLSTRVVMNFAAAKRLALSLSQAVQRYEQIYGQIELDPRKRVKGGQA